MTRYGTLHQEPNPEPGADQKWSGSAALDSRENRYLHICTKVDMKQLLFTRWKIQWTLLQTGGSLSLSLWQKMKMSHGAHSSLSLSLSWNFQTGGTFPWGHPKVPALDNTVVLL